MSDFFAMGGYAAYVWPSYAVFALLLIFHLVGPRIAKRRVLEELLRKKRRDEIKKQNKDRNE